MDERTDAVGGSCKPVPIQVKLRVLLEVVHFAIVKEVLEGVGAAAARAVGILLSLRAAERLENCQRSGDHLLEGIIVGAIDDVAVDF